MINLSILKNAATVFKEAGKMPEYEKILDLKDQLLQMQEENSKLKEDKKQLEDQLKFDSKLIFDDNVYRNEKNEAFCSRCWDKDKIAMRLIKTPPTNDHQFTCPDCKNRFTTKKGEIESQKAAETAINQLYETMRNSES